MRVNVFMAIVDLLVLALLGGFLTFLATQLVKQTSWPSWARLVLSWVMAGVFALATAWQAGDLLGVVNAWSEMTTEALVTLFVTYWTAATIWYKVVFQGTSWVTNLGVFPSRE
jgi:hypothetical protein